MLIRWFEKLGSTGVMISALGCAACFPALGSLGSALGLGFLSSYEGLLINKLLPVFAILALLANVAVWWNHNVFWRGILSIIGPLAVLATLYPLWQYAWSTYLFYAALFLMLVVSITDIFFPARAPQCKQ